MENQTAELILEQIAQPEMLMKIAVYVLIAAAVLAVIGLCFRLARKAFVLIAIILVLSSAGFFTKARSVLEDQLNVEIPLTKVHDVIDALKNADLSEITVNGEKFTAFLEELIH